MTLDRHNHHPRYQWRTKVSPVASNTPGARWRGRYRSARCPRAAWRWGLKKK